MIPVTQRTTRLFLVFTVALSAGCISDAETESGPSMQELLNLGRATWGSTGNATYSFTMLRSCLCTGGNDSARVHVVNGSVTSLVDPTTGDVVGSPKDTLFRTIPGVFDLLQDILNRHPEDLSVRWNPTLGIPVQITTDFSSRRNEDDLSIRISELVIPES